MNLHDLDVAFLFSSDYEVHLGENFEPECDVLISPTRDLLQLCSDIGVKMTLFADVVSAWRYREVRPTSSFPDEFEEQLRSALRGGHDAQLHLHPHWLSTAFDGVRWIPDDSRFKLASLGYGTPRTPGIPTANEVIDRGCRYLEALLRPVMASYSCVAFRAGGYGIQPDEQRLFEALLSSGVRIESSVVPGMRYFSNVNSIDFTDVPPGINYFLSPAQGLAAAASEGLFEIPIPAFKESVTETVRRRIGSFASGIAREAQIRSLRLGEGKPRGRGIQRLSLLRRFVERFLTPEMFALELSGPVLDVPRLVAGTERFIRERAGDSRRVFVSPSCHPKDVYGSTLDGFREYWEAIRRIFPRARAITYLEAATEITQPVH